MSRYPEADLGAIKTQPIEARHSKVSIQDFAAPVTPEMASIIHAMPKILGGQVLRDVVEAIGTAAKAKRPTIVMLGGHVIKTGCAPLLIQLMDAGVITGLVMHGATAIHDYETARFGQTSEDVEAALGSGNFGMSDETSREMNETVNEAVARKEGLGEAWGRRLEETQAPHRHLSLLAKAYQSEIPLTVHVALGTDILHQHGSANGASFGEATLRDFRILAQTLTDFDGGVILNLGSAVILPEVFLKAFSVAANLGKPPKGITAVNFDFIRHYRPRVNVLQRPTASGRGRAFELTGHHEILIPLLTAGVLEALQKP